MTNRPTILFFMFMIQMGESVYSSFSPGHKEHSQSAHEALLRAKLLSNDNNEDKQDCTEGNFLFIFVSDCMSIAVCTFPSVTEVS